MLAYVRELQWQLVCKLDSASVVYFLNTQLDYHEQLPLLSAARQGRACPVLSHVS
jgi:hypothetical protein